MKREFRCQQTIERVAVVRGYGYWTGLDVEVQFRPAAAGEGITFVRRDIVGEPRLVAHVAQRHEVPRRTSLKSRDCQFEMVEHIMAALAGMGIDNCQVWVDRAEMPGCDGSSLPLVEALAGAGLKPLPAWRSILDIRRKTKVGDASSWIEAVPWADGLRLTYHLDYPGHPAIGQQTIDLVITQESFVKELAPARTFLLVEEAEWLRAQGLGGRVTPSELLVFDQHGPVQNELRFANECVRHKALDVVGDLGLVPFDIRGHITAYRSGHALNAQLARRLLQEGDIVAPQRRAA